MPALHVTDYFAEVVWLGVVSDREARLDSDGRDELTLTFAGPEGEEHGGETRPSCSCLLYTSPSPRDGLLSRMPSSA